ncbi:MAG TPA: GTPase ObgE [Pirellulales bacterium]|jgi:GTP-binding protein|nr:GTPase ObgE [Pirellulales bacterium]
MFVDRVKIHVLAGNGGRGCVSFRREKFVPEGGPDGGDGGRGGSVILFAEEGVDSLAPLAHRQQWKAEKGEGGGGANCHGKSAADLILKVPPGTVVFDAQTDLLIKDLAAPGDSVIAAHGGRGGKGNLHFKTSINRAPREAQPGGEGESKHLVLELKVIADVGLIGKPNAGKSTLLSRLSRARPEIAAYPFTTKYPNLGRVQIDYERTFVIADLPGLIEGAHHGAGLGHEFLRHIERSGLLVHLVEPAPLDGTDPVANYQTIRHELEEYDVKLGQRPEILAVSKAELPEAADVQRRLREELGRDAILISAVTGQGLDVLTRTVWQHLSGAAAV